MAEPTNPLVAFSEHAAQLVERLASSIVAVHGGGRGSSSDNQWRSGVIVTAEAAQYGTPTGVTSCTYGGVTVGSHPPLSSRLLFSHPGLHDGLAGIWRLQTQPPTACATEMQAATMRGISHII